MLHELIYDELKTLAGGDVFPGVVSERKSVPYISFFQVSNNPSPNSDRTGSTVDEIRYQVSCFDNTYADVWTLAGSARTALDEHSGTAHDVTVDRILFDGENYIYEGGGIHHVAIDFIVRVKR